MNKNVLITGASRGIGACTAALLADEGCRVAAVYKSSEEKAKVLCREHSGIISYQCDVSDCSEVALLKEKTDIDFGHIDVIINNAGVSVCNLVTDVSDSEFDYIMNTNVKGMFNITREFLPALINKKRGTIVNVSSIWGICGASCETIYSASKGAVIAFTKALAKEVGPSGILVNCVAPGVIDTEMNAAIDKNAINALCEETPLCRLGTPEEIAKVILFLVSESAGFITGQVISPNGGFVI